MIKTLRITGIVAAILAVVFVVFPAVFGFRSDTRVDKVLKSPGAVEKFKEEAKGKRSPKDTSRISPLVREAKAFALYLNPPKPEIKPPVFSRPRPTITQRPTITTAKFELKGTAYYASHPELSLALIDKPGEGLRWVRQSSKVGYLVIEQVKDGVVVVRDGERTFELVAPRPERINLLKGASSGQTGSKSTSTALEKPPLGEISADTTNRRAAKGIRPLRGIRPPKGITPPRGVRAQQISTEEEAAMIKEIIDELEAMQRGVKSDKTGPSLIAGEDPAFMEKIIAELKSMRISDEEAKRLEELGKKLKGTQQDPNGAKILRTKRGTRRGVPSSRPD